MKRRPSACERVIIMVIALALGLAAAADDPLNAEQMKAWSGRFEKEVWPLLVRNERDGCVGCHTPRHRSMLRLSGRADEDFRRLMNDGFLLPTDPGAVLHVVSTPNPKTHMPPGKRPSWTTAEIAMVKRFVTELHTLLSSL